MEGFRRDVWPNAHSRSGPAAEQSFPSSPPGTFPPPRRLRPHEGHITRQLTVHIFIAEKIHQTYNSNHRPPSQSTSKKEPSSPFSLDEKLLSN
eukprot:m.169241 g.169241  ORF g.169241 m.169241 type:complete len:93 (-) comp14771_c0_seq1:723-1001(-)